MPTRRRRHTITETPAVERALRALRTDDPSAPIDFKELVILGAREKVGRQSGGATAMGRRESLREEFLAIDADDDGIEVEAGLDLHEGGWVSRR